MQSQFPNAKVILERGALHGKQLGSYNQNPEGKLTVTETNSNIEVASVVQAHVTEEQAPGPGLQVLKDRLAAFAEEMDNN